MTEKRKQEPDSISVYKSKSGLYSYSVRFNADGEVRRQYGFKTAAAAWRNANQSAKEFIKRKIK